MLNSLRAFGDNINSVSDRISGPPRLSIKEQVFFIKRLAFLIKANIPILESLHMVKEQTRSRRHTRIITLVIADIANGQSLAKSLGKFSRMFGDFGINIIKIGEASGTLSQNLDYLADELKKKQILRRKVLGAFVYPAIITVATLGITAFLMLFLFPKIMPIFASLHADLPFTTRVVMAMSVFLQHWGLVLVAVILALIAALTFVIKRYPRVHFIFDRLMLRVPILGTIMQQYNLATTMRTLGLLLKSGIVLSEALPLTADTTQNLVYKKEFRDLAMTVNRGEHMSSHLKLRAARFPDVLSHLISVGERSGNLSNTLVYLSDFYEAEVDDFTKNLSALIEPILMIVMGILVGFIAISIITPIYAITQHLQVH
jgi:type II secretory pathway component PulF